MSADDARRLFESDDPRAWSEALAGYPSVVAAQDISDLDQLDQWYREELPAIIHRREPPWLERDELIDIVRWKMKRGEWRARNLALVRSNTGDEIRARSTAAFAPDIPPNRALAELSVLAGVGPATASAALAALQPDVFPFLDDLVGAPIPDLGPPKFTTGYYRRYAEALRQRAERLGAGWTAQSVGFALWAAAGGKAGLAPGNPMQATRREAPPHVSRDRPIQR